mgnify:CR=1 FL=1
MKKILAVIAVVAIFATSCTKGSTVKPDAPKGETIFIRVTSVDKDGATDASTPIVIIRG